MSPPPSPLHETCLSSEKHNVVYEANLMVATRLPLMLQAYFRIGPCMYQRKAGVPSSYEGQTSFTKSQHPLASRTFWPAVIYFLECSDYLPLSYLDAPAAAMLIAIINGEVPPNCLNIKGTLLKQRVQPSVSADHLLTLPPSFSSFLSLARCYFSVHRFYPSLSGHQHN